MKFILIMCTIGRTDEPKRFLDSIAQQTYKNLKVIIIDQNKDERISSMLEDYVEKFEICYLKSDEPGLSKARNKALLHIEEGLVAFPDDDCWYPSNLLEDVNSIFQKDFHYDALCIKRYTTDSNVLEKSKIKALNKFNLWGLTSSYCLFLRNSTVINTGRFDERLGVGANTPWGAGEDTDYVLRTMKNGAKWVHLPTLKVIHPAPARKLDGNNILRVKSYARGLGKVLKINQLPWWLITASILLSVLKSARGLVFLDMPGARWHFESAKGKLEGISNDIS